ncbi:SCO0607 family lipoprotein [Streptomyces sp. NPDC085946]|uniref:SCO0607 family lipoprotein n=1 Tax=Streptomyces sp. NPDC085946 TaxID=3365744 RepID=UPI0037D80ACC
MPQHHDRFGYRAAAVLLALGAGALSLTGCSLQDAVCGGGHYPVAAVGYEGGGDCVPEGEEPPEGYVRYPEGKVPEHVGDKWDEYWNEHALDENGRETEGE